LLCYTFIYSNLRVCFCLHVFLRAWNYMSVQKSEYVYDKCITNVHISVLMNMYIWRCIPKLTCLMHNKLWIYSIDGLHTFNTYACIYVKMHTHLLHVLCTETHTCNTLNAYTLIHSLHTHNAFTHTYTHTYIYLQVSTHAHHTHAHLHLYTRVQPYASTYICSLGSITSNLSCFFFLELVNSRSFKNRCARRRFSARLVRLHASCLSLLLPLSFEVPATHFSSTL